MTQEPFHIDFYIDGFTLKKVNEYYRNYHPFRSAINFVGLRNWAREQAIRLFDPPRKYATMECHYYHPYKDPRTLSGTKQGMINFERELHFAGFQIHYLKNPNIPGNRPNTDMVNDAALFASYRESNAVVLLTTQGQFSPMPEKLRSMGIPTLLLGWNFSYEKDNRCVHWKTDSLLREKSTYYIAMEQVANRNPPTLPAKINLFGASPTKNKTESKRLRFS